MPKFKEAPGGEATTVKASEIFLISADDTTTPNQYIKVSSFFKDGATPILNPVADETARLALNTTNLIDGAQVLQLSNVKWYGWNGALGAWQEMPHQENNSQSSNSPTVNDDESAGYSVFSLWHNTTSGAVFVCADPSLGAAVWVEVGVSSVAASNVTVDDALFVNITGANAQAALQSTDDEFSNKVDKTTTVNSQPLSGNVTLTKSDVGLANVDNTSDAAKPVSTAQQAALNLRQMLSEKNQANGYAGLGSDGKVPESLLPSSVVSGLTPQGNWDAATNTPDLVSATPGNGDFWFVSVEGSTNLGGIAEWKVGDWAVYSNSTWHKIDNSDITVPSLFDCVIDDTVAFNHFSSLQDAINDGFTRISIGKNYNINFSLTLSDDLILYVPSDTTLTISSQVAKGDHLFEVILENPVTSQFLYAPSATNKPAIIYSSASPATASVVPVVVRGGTYGNTGNFANTPLTSNCPTHFINSTLVPGLAQNAGLHLINGSVFTGNKISVANNSSSDCVLIDGCNACNFVVKAVSGATLLTNPFKIISGSACDVVFSPDENSPVNYTAQIDNADLMSNVKNLVVATKSASLILRAAANNAVFSEIHSKISAVDPNGYTGLTLHGCREIVNLIANTTFTNLHMSNCFVDGTTTAIAGNNIKISNCDFTKLDLGFVLAAASNVYLSNIRATTFVRTNVAGRLNISSCSPNIQNRVSKSANYTVEYNEDVFCTNAITITVPQDTDTTGIDFNVFAGANDVTLSGGALKSISGETSITIGAYGAARVVGDGTNYRVI